MKWISHILWLFWVLGSGSFAGEPATPLTPERILPVDGPANRQPSGLTIWQDTLFTVSDRHPNTVFRLEIREESAAMIPYRNFPVTETFGNDWLDFEGITCDSAGNFYIVSEMHSRILRVAHDGQSSGWITPDLKPYGEAEGLFQVLNAYFEGITLLAPGYFLLCAERQPRGLMEVHLSNDKLTVNATQFEHSQFTFPEGVSLDFAGLYTDRDTVYVLERNAYLVARLVRDAAGTFQEGPGWSFRHIALDPRYRYRDMQYGHAEGLCLDRHLVYVIFDNNGDFREQSPGDNRPLLLILHRPGR